MQSETLSGHDIRSHSLSLHQIIHRLRGRYNLATNRLTISTPHSYNKLSKRSVHTHKWITKALDKIDWFLSTTLSSLQNFLKTLLAAIKSPFHKIITLLNCPISFKTILYTQQFFSHYFTNMRPLMVDTVQQIDGGWWRDLKASLVLNTTSVMMKGEEGFKGLAFEASDYMGHGWNMSRSSLAEGLAGEKDIVTVTVDDLVGKGWEQIGTEDLNGHLDDPSFHDDTRLLSRDIDAAIQDIFSSEDTRGVPDEIRTRLQSLKLNPDTAKSPSNILRYLLKTLTPILAYSQSIIQKLVGVPSKSLVALINLYYKILDLPIPLPVHGMYKNALNNHSFPTSKFTLIDLYSLSIASAATYQYALFTHEYPFTEVEIQVMHNVTSSMLYVHTWATHPLTSTRSIPSHLTKITSLENYYMAKKDWLLRIAWVVLLAGDMMTYRLDGMFTDGGGGVSQVLALAAPVNDFLLGILFFPEHQVCFQS